MNDFDLDFSGPLQVDTEGLYFGTKEVKYKHRYMKLDRVTGIAIPKSQTSDIWVSEKTKSRVHEFVKRRSTEEYEVVVVDTEVIK